MAEDKERPVLIKKVKKFAGGHHGGAWKLAYSDFVTAMMAFFLLMWLLGSTTDGDKKGIADYFHNPWKPALSGGRGSGDATSPIHGGGEDLTRSIGQVKRTNTGSRNKSSFSSDDSDGHFNSQRTGTPEIGEEQDETNQFRIDISNLSNAKGKLENLIEQDSGLHQYSGQFNIDITTEGLRVQMVDAENRPMFEVGSTRFEPYALGMISKIAPIIDQLPNHVSIAGHTDSRPYQGGGRSYSNWELSTDRANAARRALIASGVKDNKFMRIVGLADSVPLDSKNPLNPINRRISIIVMNRNTERQLIENSGPMVEIRSNQELPPPFAPAIQISIPSILPPNPMLQPNPKH